MNADVGLAAGAAGQPIDVVRRVVRLAMLVRLVALVAALLALVGSRLDPQTAGAMLALAATSVAGLSNERLLTIVVERPLLAMADVALVILVFVVLGVANPLTLGALSTALVIGVLYAAPLASILGTTLVLGYMGVAAGEGASVDDFLVIGIPVTLGCLVAVGQAIRTIEKQFEAAQYRLGLVLQATAVDEERGRLARDVHDGIAKSLQGLALGAAALPHWLERDGEQAAAQARQLSLGAQEAVQEARVLLGQLRADRPGEPFATVVERHVAEWGRLYDGQVAFTTAGDVPVLPTRARYELLASLREALTNTQKHAPGARVAVHLQGDGSALHLVVSDNGPGFDPAVVPAREREGHFGLRGMTERMASVNGTAAIEAAPGDGTAVILSWRPEEGPS
jgi:signal transduction histidine kinase